LMKFATMLKVVTWPQCHNLNLQKLFVKRNSIKVCFTLSKVNIITFVNACFGEKIDKLKNLQSFVWSKNFVAIHYDVKICSMNFLKSRNFYNV
jgi:hypothetical protein